MSRSIEAIVSRLAPFMKAHGFVFRKSSEAFVAKRSHGFVELALPSFFVGLDGGRQVVSVGLGVRHDQIENIVNQLGHIYGEDNRRKTSTVHRGLGFFPFKPSGPSELTIRLSHLDEDADRAADSLRLMLQEDGLSFFERYGSIFECSKGLNDPLDTPTHPLFNRHAGRAYNGIAAAALAQPERVEVLIAGYSELARSGRLRDTSVVYDIGKELDEPDAIIKRLKTVAELAG